MEGITHYCQWETCNEVWFGHCVWCSTFGQENCRWPEKQVTCGIHAGSGDKNWSGGDPTIAGYCALKPNGPRKKEKEVMVKKKLTCWDLIDQVISVSERLLEHGPAGTGKTTAPFKWASKAGWIHLAITLTPETPMTELRGHFILKGQEMVWHDGLVAQAWRKSHNPSVKGVVVVLNEIDHAGGDVMSFLHAALDDQEMAQVTLPTGETIKPAQGKVKYVATMNGSPADLPAPLRDRFPVTVHVDRVHPDAVKKLPKELQPIATNGINAVEEERRVSIRSVAAFHALRTSVGDDVAAQAVFGNRAGEFLTALAVAK